MSNGCVMCGGPRFNFGDYDEGVEMWKFNKNLDPTWQRARIRALRRSRRNVETLKREGRCR